MDQTVNSLNGRKWLTNLSPAVTSKESSMASVPEYHGDQHLPEIPAAEVIEVSIPSVPNFHTKAIHDQLHGVGTPAVSDLTQLKLPSMTDLTSEPSNYEIVFVDIPKLGEDPATTQSLVNLADRPKPESGKGEAIQSAPTIEANSAQSESSETESSESRSDAQYEIFSQSIPAISSVSAAFAANAVNQSAQTQEASALDSTLAPKPSPSDSPTPKFVGGELGVLVERIIDRFPLAAPTVLLFVGGEANPNVEETCAQVASALGACHVGKVLLIDGDVVGRQLTIASGMNDQAGLSEAINRSADWRSLVVSQDSASFSFLPAGACPMDRWNSNELLRQMNAEMKNDFQFICVAAGDAHTKHAKLWCEVCDGSYLIVSLKNSNETYAKSAVQELTNNGARVLGCVVADAE